MSIVTEEKTIIYAPKKTRDRGYRRNQRARHIREKADIKRFHNEEVGVVGKLDKGKVHCSCSLCAFHEYTMPDLKRAHEMDSELKDSEFVVEHNNRMRKMVANTSRERGYGARHIQKTKSIVDMSILDAERRYQKAIRHADEVWRAYLSNETSYEDYQTAKEEVKEAKANSEALWCEPLKRARRHA